jgi:hypothetical protein
MMKLDARTAPDRDVVRAYLMTFSEEGPVGGFSKLVMADLEAFVDHVSRNKMDNTGRTDPYKLAAGDAVREMLRRIKSMTAMESNPEWQAIERARQLAAAQQKDKRNNG